MVCRKLFEQLTLRSTSSSYIVEAWQLNPNTARSHLFHRPQNSIQFHQQRLPRFYEADHLQQQRLYSATEATEATAAVASNAYPFAQAEQKWQKYWEEHHTFRTPDRTTDMSRPKKYILDMFPYPSGAGLHVGHPEGYTASDVMARYYRMNGHDVLHPIGWDSFGLPAEQFAIQTGQAPAITTAQNIANFKRQLKSLGFSYDWDREIATTDTAYVKWTQWIFLQLFKKGLAAQSEVAVNWCSALGTVLANEEVIDGLSERGNHPVERIPLRQWVLKITQYAVIVPDGQSNPSRPSSN